MSVQLAFDTIRDDRPIANRRQPLALTDWQNKAAFFPVLDALVNEANAIANEAHRLQDCRSWRYDPRAANGMVVDCFVSDYVVEARYHQMLRAIEIVAEVTGIKIKRGERT